MRKPKRHAERHRRPDRRPPHRGDATAGANMFRDFFDGMRDVVGIGLVCETAGGSMLRVAANGTRGAPGVMARPGSDAPDTN